MLDPRGPLPFPECPGLRVYADDRLQEAYYALPDPPRVGLDDEGRPQIALTLYGRRKAGVFEPTGGLVALTTTLQLTREEEQVVQAAWLRRLLASRPPNEPPGTPPPRPQRLAVDWVETEVELRLTAEVVLAGHPSLMGANECAFNARVDAAQARALKLAWEAGLPDATVTYRARIRAAAATGSASTYSSTRVDATEQPGGTTVRVESFEVSASRRGGSVAQALTLHGPLAVAPPAGRLELIEL